ncbi:DUF2971 domain-containing protein, partial [bacterium]|nr:DUF2971 domain-containing protein [bacterium]
MLPKYLYKYINWSNKYHRRIITHSEIYFSSPSLFNDPFDSAIPVRFDVGTKDQKMNSIMRALRRQHPNKSLKKLGKMARVIKEELKDPNLMRERYSSQVSMYQSNTAIFCLSETYKSIIMWSHYSNEHKGLCIRFNTAKLKKHLETDLFQEIDRVSFIAKVNYQQSYPLINF